MPTEVRLTPTSYIVLGLVNALGECTPYDLKQVVAAGLGQIWWLHHAQLYSEPQRLAEAGYLSERKETGGRRRKHYEITEAGRRALEQWLAEPTAELIKVRYLSMLKLALGVDPKRLAEVQLPGEEARLAEYEALVGNLDASIPRTIRLLGELAIEQARELVSYWRGLAGTGRRPPAASAARQKKARLTPNAYFVLHLVKEAGEATPYQLKRTAADPSWDFWTIPHAQLYSEPRRLAEAGYLSERKETGGRRRKHYEITEAGRRALEQWLAEPEASADELRDLATVKLFFGADPQRQAQAQLPLHREKLAEYERLRKSLDNKGSPGLRTAVEAGIAGERILVSFWKRLLDDLG